MFAGLTGHGIHVYMDDIIIQGTNLNDIAKHLEIIILRLHEDQLKINLKKDKDCVNII